jgi:hypothetical protein
MAPQIARLAAPLAGCTRQQTAAPFARLALTALRFNRGAFDCRQLDRICERRRFEALLESRLGFWLRGGLGSDMRACAGN